MGSTRLPAAAAPARPASSSSSSSSSNGRSSTPSKGSFNKNKLAAAYSSSGTANSSLTMEERMSRAARVQHPHGAPRSASSFSSPSSSSPSPAPSASIVTSAILGREEAFVRGRPQPTPKPAPVAPTPDSTATAPASTATTFAKSSSRPASLADDDNLFGKRRRRDSSRSTSSTATTSTTTTPSSAKRAKKATATADDVEWESAGSAVTTLPSQPHHIEHLSYRTLSVGMTMLAAIKKIDAIDMHVSLPNNMTAFLHMRDLSEPFKRAVDAHPSSSSTRTPPSLPALGDIFQVGQIIRVAIRALLKHGDVHRIELSTAPSVVNASLSSSSLVPGMLVQGAIKGVLEKGYEVDLAFTDSQVTGFLPFAHAPPLPAALAQQQQSSHLPIGFPLTCAISSISSRAVSLTALPTELADATIAPKDVTYDTLTPGALVRARIEKVLQTGVLVMIGSSFRGSIELLHMPVVIRGSKKSLLASFKPGQLIKARVVYVNNETKCFALSAKPHVVSMTPFDFDSALVATVGDRLSGRVVRVEPKVGVYFACSRGGASSTESKSAEDKEDAGDNSDAAMTDDAERKDGKDAKDTSSTLLAFAHVSRLSDEQLDASAVGRRFTVGTSHDVRLLSFDRFDGLLSISLQPSVLSLAILSIDDVEAGQDVQGKVAAVGAFGVLVQLTPTIRGLVLPTHLADIKLSDPSKKFTVGSSIKARVLLVEKEQRRILLTCKTSLLDSNLPMILSVASCTRGQLAIGTITNVNDSGCFVEFYNRVSGLVPTADLLEHHMIRPNQKPQDVYRVGDLAKVRVTRASKAKGRLHLSFMLADPLNKAGGAASSAAAAGSDSSHKKTFVRAGSILGAAVAEVFDDRLTVRFPDSDIVGTLTAAHLTDRPSLASSLVRTYAVGDALERVLVLKVDMKHLAAVVTLKPALLHAVTLTPSAFPRSMVSVAVGQTLVGYVSHVHSYGVFLQFSDRVSALAPVSALADTFVTDVASMFAVGQTVRAVVTKFDEESKRLQVSLKPSAFASDDAQSSAANGANGAGAAFTSSFFADLARISQRHVRDSVAANASALKEWARVAPGSLAELTVLVVKPDGVLFGVQAPILSSFTAFAVSPFGTASAADLAVGKKVKARVLDVDVRTKVLDVSLRPELLVAREHGSAAAAPTAGKGKKNKKGKAAEAVAADASSSAPALPTLGQSVQVVVHAVHDDHVVLSLVDFQHVLAYACLRMSNFASSSPQSSITPGFTCSATVVQLPASSSPDSLPLDSSHRLLVTLDLPSADAATNANAANASHRSSKFYDEQYTRGSAITKGSVVRCKVSGVDERTQSVQLELSERERVNKKFTAAVHVSDIADIADALAEAERATANKPYRPLDVWVAKKGEFVAAKVVRFTVSHESKSANANADAAAADDAHVDDAAHKTGARTFFSMTLRASAVSTSEKDADDAEDDDASVSLHKFSSLSVGTRIPALVTAIDAKAHIIWLAVSRKISAVMKRCDVVGDALKVGDMVACTVLRADTTRRTVEVRIEDEHTSEADGGPRIRPAVESDETAAAAAAAAAEIKVGDVVDGVVTRVLAGMAVLVKLSNSVFARAHITRLHDEFVANPFSSFAVGTSVRAAVVRVTKKSGQSGVMIDVSLRPRDVQRTAAASSSSTEAIETINDVHVGQIVQGYVESSGMSGVFVTIAPSVTGRVLLKDLSDLYITDVAGSFPTNTLVRGRVLAVDAASGHVALTLRHSAVEQSSKAVQFGDLRVGQLIKGVVTRVHPQHGVFVRLKHCALKGLCHTTEVSDASVADASKFYAEGDKVRAIILRLNAEKQRISLGFKESYVNEALKKAQTASGAKGKGKAAAAAAAASAAVEEVESEDEFEVVSAYRKKRDVPEPPKPAAAEATKTAEVTKTAAKPAAAAPSPSSSVSASTSSMVVDSTPELDDPFATAPSLSLAPATTSATTDSSSSHADVEMANGDADHDDGDLADDNDDDEDHDDDDNDDDSSSSAKLSRRVKLARKREAEMQLELAEQRLMDPSAAPESAQDFERAVMASPNSSYTWIQYMSYHLALQETEKARAVAERALKAINFREEKEKHNVWVAYISLENMYGTDGSLQRVLARAMERCSQLPLMLETAELFALTNKDAKATEMYRSAAKKFPLHMDVWLKHARFLMSRGSAVEARALMTQALPRFEKKKEQVELIVKFAQIEFSGVHEACSCERGRTLMDGLLDTYKKRADLWTVYVDMECKAVKRLHAAAEEATSAVASASSAASAADVNQRLPEMGGGVDANGIGGGVALTKARVAHARLRAKQTSAASSDAVAATRRLFERAIVADLRPLQMKAFFKRYLEFEKTYGGANDDRMEYVKEKARQYVMAQQQKTGAAA